MIKKILAASVVLILSGCFGYKAIFPTTQEAKRINKVAVIIKISDELRCRYTGITIFNNIDKTYPLAPVSKVNYESIFIDHLKSKNIQANLFDGELIQYKNPEKGASTWGNIQLDESVGKANDVNTLLIVDGGNNFSAKGGYYAKNDALITWVNIYLYNISSGKLIGKDRASRINKRKFSCRQERIPNDDNIPAIAEAAIIEMGKELVRVMFPDTRG